MQDVFGLRDDIFFKQIRGAFLDNRCLILIYTSFLAARIVAVLVLATLYSGAFRRVHVCRLKLGKD
jgi:hypothetical protein